MDFRKNNGGYPTLVLFKEQMRQSRDWLWFARFIEQYGVDGSFCGKTYRYLYWGEYRYWMMDPTPEQCDLINRCLIPEGERKPENYPSIINGLNK